MVIEYRGKEPIRFYHLSKHLLKSLHIENYQHYQGRKENYIQLFIAVDKLSLSDADEMVEKISDALAMRLAKSWKCFPDNSLPDSYNILTLPYALYEV